MGNVNRRIENEEQKFIYTVKIGFVGNLQLEQMIDKYLQETLEQYFCERGEKIDFCFIDQINKYKK